MCTVFLRHPVPVGNEAFDRLFAINKAVTEGLEADTDHTGNDEEGHSHQAADQREWPHPHLRSAKHL